MLLVCSMKEKGTLETNGNEKKASPSRSPGQPHFPALSQPLSVSVYIILLAIAIIATRVSFRAMNLAAATRNKRSRRVLVYGAGNFGRMLVREMRSNTAWNMNPVAFIDDDAAKVHRWIVGVPVRGSIDSLEAIMRQYGVDEVILSSRAINGSIETRIREICANMNRPVKRLHMEIE